MPVLHNAQNLLWFVKFLHGLILWDGKNLLVQLLGMAQRNFPGARNALYVKSAKLFCHRFHELPLQSVGENPIDLPKLILHLLQKHDLLHLAQSPRLQ